MQPTATDVMFAGGRVTAILSPGERHVGRSVEVACLTIAPGFIDLHAHSDLEVLANPARSAKVIQGVTLEAVGKDDLDYSRGAEVMAALRSHIAGWDVNPVLDCSWRSFGDYLDRVGLGTATNVATLVSHGTVRMARHGYGKAGGDGC